MTYQHLYLNQVRRKSKYLNKSCVFDGFRYDSIKEANYAEELTWQKKAGEIKDFDRQVTFNLIVEGKKIAGIRPDFLVYMNDGSQEIHEVKSSATMTAVWKVKWNLLQAIYPNFEYKVII